LQNGKTCNFSVLKHTFVSLWSISIPPIFSRHPAKINSSKFILLKHAQLDLNLSSIQKCHLNVSISAEQFSFAQPDCVPVFHHDHTYALSDQGRRAVSAGNEENYAGNLFPGFVPFDDEAIFVDDVGKGENSVDETMMLLGVDPYLSGLKNCDFSIP